jgi:hypothetical protein
MYLKNLMNFMPRGLQEVIRREGNPIKYLPEELYA